MLVFFEDKLQNNFNVWSLYIVWVLHHAPAVRFNLLCFVNLKLLTSDIMWIDLES